MNAADFLARVPLFSRMQKKDLQRLAEQVSARHYDAGEVIIRQGEDDTRLFMLVRGKVEVIKNMDTPNGRSLRVMQPPGYFGEMAMIDGMVRSASVVALTEADLFSLDRINLAREVGRTPALAMELLRMMCSRIRAIEKCLVQSAGEGLPICLHCGRVHGSVDGWVPIAKYIEAHEDADLTRSICPECAQERFPRFYEQ